MMSTNPVTSLCRYVTCTTVGMLVSGTERQVCSSELDDAVLRIVNTDS
jgi:succinate dehydrogenase/fumarate reductase-like Fe-S protein